MKKLYAMFYDGNVFGLAKAKHIEEVSHDQLCDIQAAVEDNDYVVIYDTEPLEGLCGQVYDAREDIPENAPIEPVYRITADGIYDYSKLEWVTE